MIWKEIPLIRKPFHFFHIGSFVKEIYRAQWRQRLVDASVLCGRNAFARLCDNVLCTQLQASHGFFPL